MAEQVRGILAITGVYVCATGMIEYPEMIPQEKRPGSEQLNARVRPPVDTDIKFYNSARWRKLSVRERIKRPWCEIHMLYVLTEMGLDDIIPWFSKLDPEMKLRFLKRKGYEGEILSCDVMDHIIPIKAPFSGSYWNPKNHQTASHRYHNIKRTKEKEEIVEEYIDAPGGRIPLRMLEGLKRYSDPRGGQNPSGKV